MNTVFFYSLLEVSLHYINFPRHRKEKLNTHAIEKIGETKKSQNPSATLVKSPDKTTSILIDAYVWVDNNRRGGLASGVEKREKKVVGKKQQSFGSRQSV